MKGFSKFTKAFHLLGDVLILNFAFFAAYYLKFEGNYKDILSNHYSYFFIVYNSIWLVIVLSLNIYNIERAFRIEQVLLNLTKTIIIHALILFSFIITINGFYFSRTHLFYTYIMVSFLMLFWRFVVVYIIKFLRSEGANYKQVIIVGAGATGIQIYNYFKTEISTGYRFLGFFDDNKTECLYKQQIIGNVYDVPAFALNNKIDEIFCTLPLTATRPIRELMTFADNNLIRFKIVPDFRGFFNKKVQMDFYNSVPVLTIRREPLESLFNRFLKRTFDIAFSLAVILMVFPVTIPLLIALIKLSSPGPAFFVQKRSGRNNKSFLCLKLRTMTVNKDADNRQACKEDCRITRLGKVLRKTNLDELPQFFNVLFGNMSVVGPRPHMLLHTKEYSMIIDKFMVRHLVKPGITGWAQVNGLRGSTENPKQMVKRVRYDRWYVENWSFILDLKIIFLTVYNMIKGEKNAFRIIKIINCK